MIQASTQAEVPSSENSPSYVDVFADYRRQIDALLDIHIPRRPAAILQFPYDGNVGNHMMWVATTEYLRSRKIPVVYAANGVNFNLEHLSRVIGNGSILFLGGVTISKLWPRHAEVKREVAERFPNNALISLPATVLFTDSEDSEQASTIFGNHPNVTVMARDPVSCEQARRAFPEHVRVLTVPDMALRLSPQKRQKPPEHNIVWLARDDKEGVGEAVPDDLFVFDWPHDLRKHVPKMYAFLRASGVFSRLRASKAGGALAGIANPPLTEFYRRASLEMLNYGNRMLDLGQVLVTDRLHPHVLTALRDQPAVLLPDKFGKNRAVYEHYTHKFKQVHFAETPKEALALARSLVR